MIDPDLTKRCLLDDVELAWNRWGPDVGRPFVLCHGFSGSAHDFALHVEALAADRPVLALDHRGHGRSTKTHDVASYTVAQLTEDFVAFLEATASEPVDLLGHSMGGRIALMTALERPDLVHSLVLMDTSAWSFLPEDGDVRALFVEFIERFDPGRGLPDLTSRAGPEEALIAAATPPAWQARKAELSAAFDPHAFKGLGLQIFADHLPSARSRLAELTLPVSVLVGEHDHPFADQAPDLAREAGDRPLHVIPGAYHSPQLTHPDAWRTAVTDHLAEADAG